MASAVITSLCQLDFKLGRFSTTLLVWVFFTVTLTFSAGVLIMFFALVAPKTPQQSLLTVNFRFQLNYRPIYLECL